MSYAKRIALAVVGMLVAQGANAQSLPTLPLPVPIMASSTIPCVVRPMYHIDLAPTMQGVVKSVDVRPGQRVRQGDVIARFDTALLEVEMAMAQARADDASAEENAKARVLALSQRHERMQRALTRKALSQAEVEMAALDLAQAQGELNRIQAERALLVLQAERTRLELERAVIKAPVDGTVAEGVIAVGESASMDQPIAVITVTSPLRLEAYVPARLAPAVMAASDHRAIIAGHPYQVDFDYASAVADVSSNTISIFFTLKADELLPGLECQLSAPILGNVEPTNAN